MWNSGNFSSTVDISPFTYDTLGSLYFPHPKFVNCSLVANDVPMFGTHIGEAKLINVGSFTVYGFKVQFEESVEYQEHRFTALRVTEGAVTFLPGTKALFQNNSGSQGGALSLYGSSSLRPPSPSVTTQLLLLVVPYITALRTIMTSSPLVPASYKPVELIRI